MESCVKSRLGWKTPPPALCFSSRFPGSFVWKGGRVFSGKEARRNVPLNMVGLPYS